MDGAQVTSQLIVKPTDTGVAVDYDDVPMVANLGAGIPIEGRWKWSFDRTLALVASEEAAGSDWLGEYSSVAITYADESGSMVRQWIKTYQEAACVVVESMALRELRGTALGDSFFETTFNSPVVHLAGGLSYLTYT